MLSSQIGSMTWGVFEIGTIIPYYIIHCPLLQLGVDLYALSNIQPKISMKTVVFWKTLVEKRTLYRPIRAVRAGLMSRRYTAIWRCMVSICWLCQNMSHSSIKPAACSFIVIWHSEMQFSTAGEHSIFVYDFIYSSRVIQYLLQYSVFIFHWINQKAVEWIKPSFNSSNRHAVGMT